MGMEYWVDVEFIALFNSVGPSPCALASPVETSLPVGDTLKAKCPFSSVQASKVAWPSQTRSMRTVSAGRDPSSNITLPVKNTTRSALLSMILCPGFWPRTVTTAANSSTAPAHARQPIPPPTSPNNLLPHYAPAGPKTEHGFRRFGGNRHERQLATARLVLESIASDPSES